jgi:hypothetical protein
MGKAACRNRRWFLGLGQRMVRHLAESNRLVFTEDRNRPPCALNCGAWLIRMVQIDDTKKLKKNLCLQGVTGTFRCNLNQIAMGTVQDDGGPIDVDARLKTPVNPIEFPN